LGVGVGRMRAALSVVRKMCRKSYVGVGTEDGQLLGLFYNKP